MKKYTIGNKVIKAESEKRGTIIEVMPACCRQLYNRNWREHGRK